jgi:long-chain acyl-CoA synthetase
MQTTKPWLKFYEPEVPEQIDYPDIPMPEFLSSTARRYPDRAAIIFKAPG